MLVLAYCVLMMTSLGPKEFATKETLRKLCLPDLKNGTSTTTPATTEADANGVKVVSGAPFLYSPLAGGVLLRPTLARRRRSAPRPPVREEDSICKICPALCQPAPKLTREEKLQIESTLSIFELNNLLPQLQLRDDLDEEEWTDVMSHDRRRRSVPSMAMVAAETAETLEAKEATTTWPPPTAAATRPTVRGPSNFLTYLLPVLTGIVNRGPPKTPKTAAPAMIETTMKKVQEALNEISDRKSRVEQKNRDDLPLLGLMNFEAAYLPNTSFEGDPPTAKITRATCTTSAKMYAEDVMMASLRTTTRVLKDAGKQFHSLLVRLAAIQKVLEA